MNNDEPISVVIREYWSVIVRLRRVVIATILGSLILAGLLCLVLPKSYRSSTLILIENAKIPEDYVKGLVGASVEERLTMLQQQVLSRTLLSQIVEDFDLYEAKAGSEEMDLAIEKLRKHVKVETVGTLTNRGKSVEAFTISFAHEDPMIAMKVTAKLASLYIEENLKVREQMVTGVSAFLEQELNAAKAALEAQEQAIGKFKTKHIGLLPEQMEANLRALDRLQSDLNATDELLRKQIDRMSLVEKSVTEYETSGATQSAFGTLGANHATVDPLVIRLRELEKHLTTLQAEYKETYPDIGHTKQEILGIKRQLAAKYGDPSDERDADAAKTYDPYLRELLKQRNELRLEVVSVKERRRRLAEHIREFENRVEQTPSREQELMILIRDYQNMQKNYQALLDKRLNAHVAENLEKRQKGEQFRVLDPANLPTKPEKPNRLLIMLIGLIGGCGLGVGLSIGLEQLNPTFKRREEVEMLPGIRVLAAIPNFLSVYRHLSDQAKKPLESSFTTQMPAIREGWRSHSSKVQSNDGSSVPPQLNLVAKWQPLSIAAEQYRMAATRLVLSTEEHSSAANGHGSKIIGITSALKGEGKTTTVANLGYTLARDLGKRTLLIDCDFRCPALQQYVNVPAQAGLLELLDGRVQLPDCLSAIDEVPCSIITIGNTRGEVNEIGRIQQLKGLLPNLRMHFDYILFNTPPVLPSATMGILASLADILIMVIRAGNTPKHIVQQAFTMLGLTTEAHVILNAVETQSMPSYIYGYPLSYGGERSIEGARR
jgi:polysaccharide chain length determinant protein (PEP-CTERM system associated)